METYAEATTWSGSGISEPSPAVSHPYISAPFVTSRSAITHGRSITCSERIPIRRSCMTAGRIATALSGLSVGLLTVAAFTASAGHAETLRSALRRAYSTNPTIAAQRSTQRASEENVSIAKANGLPSAGLTSDFTENLIRPYGSNATSGAGTPYRQVQNNVQLSVPLYAGGGIRSQVDAARVRAMASYATTRATEADVFYAVVGSYMDVLRDQAAVSLYQRNVRVLETTLQATRDRFQAGDLTRTDVAQAEARLALAASQLQVTSSRLIQSRENYARLVGDQPVDLRQPGPLPNLPADPDDAVRVALARNPSISAAQREAAAAGYDVGAARATRLPRITAQVGGSLYDALGSYPKSSSGGAARQAQEGPNSSASLVADQPVYQGGRPAALVRQTTAFRQRAIEDAISVERDTIAQVRSAYAAWRKTAESIRSTDTAVKANELSLEGVRAENQVGNRTILDLLNAEQELLNSQVQSLTARRDAYVAAFALLVAMGRAQADDLLIGADEDDTSSDTRSPSLR